MAEFKDLVIGYWDSPVAIGQKCRVALQFKYQGPAVTKALHVGIGNDKPIWQGGFDEVVDGDDTIDIPTMPWLTLITTYVEVPITDAIDPAGSPYDIYAKADGLQSPKYLDVITIASGTPEDEGEIEKVELDLDDAWQVIPKAIEQNIKTRIRVTSRNTGTTSYHVTCKWQVKNPLGTTVDSYDRLSWDLASPDERNQFNKQIWDTFPLSTIGDYQVEIWLYNYDTNEQLDHLTTKLCTVSEAPEPPPEEREYRYFKIDSWQPDPAYLAMGDTLKFNCSFEYRSPDAHTVKLHAAIGLRVGIFEEKDAKEITVSLTASPTWKAKNISISVVFNHPQLLIHNYDAYCKLMISVLKEYFDYKDNIVTWGESPVPLFEKLAVSYKI